MDAREAFERLHTGMREQLWAMGWKKLRRLQIEAIESLTESRDDLLIAAATASGKTEAAFLPVLSDILSDDESTALRALYVGPLKALINDQFRRIEDLCVRTELAVHRWHGDVGQGSKRRLLANPSGVLLITPESLESIFVNHADRLGKLLGGLRWVVIDELHAFIGDERGAHLRSLLHRIDGITKAPPRRIGLSATFGDPKEAARWMSPGRTPKVISSTRGRSLKLRLHGFLHPSGEDVEDEVQEEKRRVASTLLQHFRGRSGLVFGSSKHRLEEFADLARRQAEVPEIRESFLVHHASLSRSHRELTEMEMRSDRPTTVFCSSTLEMGIDVGSVEVVGQLGAPWSVASLTQRLGRSGRREGEAAELRIYIDQDEVDPERPIPDRLYPSLVQAIAMTELIVREKWCEPPETESLHLSTLVQQILSVVRQTGGASPAALYGRLCQTGPFSNVDADTFKEVLRSLGQKDVLEQLQDGDLILGLEGESIVASHHFYAAFESAEEMTVLHDGRAIGQIQLTPDLEVGGHLILAGQRWKIIGIELEEALILVKPSQGGRPPKWGSTLGPLVHQRVRERMRDLLGGQDSLPYLDSKAQEIFEKARSTAQQFEVTARPLVSEGSGVYWFPWCSSRIQTTLACLARTQAGPTARVEDHDIALGFPETTPGEIEAAFEQVLAAPPPIDLLAKQLLHKSTAKYDYLLSNDLRLQIIRANHLDLPGALDAIRALSR